MLRLKAIRKNQRGIGLLELMLSLAIIAVLLVMATRYYKSADEGQKVNNSISLLTGIAGAAAQYVSNYPNVDLKDIQTLVNEHYLPANFANMKSPWGTNITATSTGSVVTVTMESVPGAACRRIQASISGASGCAASGDAAANLIVNY